MNKAIVELQMWELKGTLEKEIEIPEKNDIDDIQLSYDGGRIGLSINGKEVFYTTNGGNDCTLNLKFNSK
jgi:hypothetical protein